MIPVFILPHNLARLSPLFLLEFLSARQSVAPVPPVSSLAPLPSCGDRGLQRSEAKITLRYFVIFED